MLSYCRGVPASAATGVLWTHGKFIKNKEIFLILKKKQEKYLLVFLKVIFYFFFFLKLRGLGRGHLWEGFFHHWCYVGLALAPAQTWCAWMRRLRGFISWVTSGWGHDMMWVVSFLSPLHPDIKEAIKLCCPNFCIKHVQTDSWVTGLISQRCTLLMPCLHMFKEIATHFLFLLFPYLWWSAKQNVILSPEMLLVELLQAVTFATVFPKHWSCLL